MAIDFDARLTKQQQAARIKQVYIDPWILEAFDWELKRRLAEKAGESAETLAAIGDKLTALEALLTGAETEHETAELAAVAEKVAKAEAKT
ncbi:MAG: hypothetical protein Q8P38_05575 [Candidatus Nanopelagicales bacterium]|nr:hypothetical protein [Candidatus Nanopelagicales bacterium]